MGSTADAGIAAAAREPAELIVNRRKLVAIVQSNYIPWKGYFDLIRSVDEFVLLDEVQFTKRDWRNRNRIKTAAGARWLSVPVVSKGRYTQAIDETEIAESWVDKHWAALRHSYGRAAHFREFAEPVRALYDAAADEMLLSRVNYRLLVGICAMIGIATPIRFSREYATRGVKTDRLLSICAAAGATHYLSGPAARAYLETDKFAAQGIAVVYADYSGYPEYPQLCEPFEHGVSILDLLFNTGRDAPRYMKRMAS
jgi:hypothetical protein